MLKKWDISYAEDLAKTLNNRIIHDNLRDGLPFPYTKQDAKNFISTMINVDANKVFAFAIFVDEKCIGSIAAFRQDNIHYRSAEIGYYLAESYWRKGIATKAIKEICQYVFAHTNIVRIYAMPFSQNIGSRKALEKSGFCHEGTLRKNAEKNGTLVDMEMYSLIKE